ncbi:MAG TPA: class I SAM-dependent methyltransferase [Vicinamibacterales bacterium]|nr:class I SAM-dependent methyltransferase [Vicinamibacterales bacterium]
MRLVTAAIFATAQLFARGARVLHHLAAGTLRIADLRVGIEDVWERSSPSDAAVAAGLMEWEEEVVRRFVTLDDRVLLVGSGPGRDFVALVARGYRVTGIEPARRAIATAQRHLAERGLSAEIVEGFFEDVPLTGRFDVILFSYCCYSFIPGSGRRIAALRKAADHLAPSGRIVISYLTERSGHPALMRLARLSSALSRSDWRPEPGDIVHPVDPAAPLYHYEHPFMPGEIDAEARAAGLQVAHRCDFPANPVVVLVSATA